MDQTRVDTTSKDNYGVDGINDNEELLKILSIIFPRPCERTYNPSFSSGDILSHIKAFAILNQLLSYPAQAGYVQQIVDAYEHFVQELWRSLHYDSNGQAQDEGGWPLFRRNVNLVGILLSEKPPTDKTTPSKTIEKQHIDWDTSAIELVFKCAKRDVNETGGQCTSLKVSCLN